MDHFNAIRLFIRIVERRSFTLAAEDLGMPRSTGTEAIKQLESRLGVRLLQRTTRHVSPTLEGQAYYERCIALLAELDEAEGSLRDAAMPRGLIRVNAPGLFARHFLLPALPAFMKIHPYLQVHLAQSDQIVDLVRDGVDCILSMGEPKDSTLIGQRVASLEVVTCASPDYLQTHGTPSTLDDLKNHGMVGFSSSEKACFFPLSFTQTGGEVQQFFLPARVSVTDDGTQLAMAKFGFGLVQIPRYQAAGYLESGHLVQVLPDLAVPLLPVSLLYTQNRQLTPRVRVFIDWVVATLAGDAGLA